MIPDHEISITLFDPHPPGGQHAGVPVRTIRAEHLPSGLVAMVTDERSQHRARAIAVAMLEAGLACLRGRP